MLRENQPVDFSQTLTGPICNPPGSLSESPNRFRHSSVQTRGGGSNREENNKITAGFKIKFQVDQQKKFSKTFSRTSMNLHGCRATRIPSTQILEYRTPHPSRLGTSRAGRIIRFQICTGGSIIGRPAWARREHRPKPLDSSTIATALRLLSDSPLDGQVADDLGVIDRVGSVGN